MVCMVYFMFEARLGWVRHGDCVSEDVSLIGIGRASHILPPYFSNLGNQIPRKLLWWMGTLNIKRPRANDFCIFSPEF